jgi:outer membrane usher protein
MELGSGRRNGSVAFQQSLPESSGVGYRASASYGEVKRLEAWAGYQGSHGLYDIQAARAGKTMGLRLGASGTIGTMSGAVFASRRLSESFAQVRVNDIEGVRVYSNNQLIGKTNKNGLLLVPRLLPYNANRISIDPSDVPMDVTLATTERIVRPYLRSGVVVRFGSGRAHGGLLRVLLPDGSAVPAGATIENPDTGESFVVAPGGEAYVTGLSEKNRLRVTWGGNACEISVPFRPADTLQQDLGDYTCPIVSLAAR